MEIVMKNRLLTNTIYHNIITNVVQCQGVGSENGLTQYKP